MPILKKIQGKDILIKEEQIHDYLSFLSKPFSVKTRSLDTVYTNNNNLPIIVSASIDMPANASYRQVTLYINGQYMGTQFTQNTAREIKQFYFIVAPGQTYEIRDPSDRCSVYVWYET